MKYQELFNYLSEEFYFLANESEMQEIERIVLAAQKQGQTLPLDSVSVSSFSEEERGKIIEEIEFLNAQNLNGRETEEQLYKQGIADTFDYLTDKSNSR